MYPHAHQIALRENLFCRTLVEQNGTTSVAENITAKMLDAQRTGSIKILWHQPCQKTDSGAHCDLNTAMTRVLEEKLYAQPLLP